MIEPHDESTQETRVTGDVDSKPSPAPPPRKKARRGFAAMSPEKQRELASRGGSTAHARGSAHKFSEEEARAAGKKGGASISQDREHMASIGRKGGHARARSQKAG